MPWVRIGSLPELPPGSLAEATIREERYAVCNVGGTLHAVSGVCPHRGGPLGQGALNGSNITCPWHAWEFDCRTGEYDIDPAKKIATYEVKVQDDDVFLHVP
ncbi:MAG: Rieske (2Fe-2S) protein [Bryobacteraceae bacterium]